MFLIMGPGLFAESRITLSELTYPKKISIGEKNIYISEKSSVHIYSKKDLKYITSFGSKGEGPQEYLLNSMSGFANIRMNTSIENIVITSLSKVTIYSLNGVYQKTIKIPSTYFQVIPLKEKYLVWTDLIDKKNNRFRILNIADKKLEKLNEFIRPPHDLDAIKGLFYYRTYYGFKQYNNKIYVCHSGDFSIDVFDTNGRKTGEIKHMVEKIKFTKEDGAAIINQLKLDQPAVYKYFAKKIFFPENFPAIRSFRVVDDKIYVFTYNNRNGKTQCLVFNLNGNLLKDTFIFLKEISIRKWFPFEIKDNKVYQLVENEDAEEWELVVSKIDKS